jgi:hypothetical protein
MIYLRDLCVAALTDLVQYGSHGVSHRRDANARPPYHRAWSSN